MTIRNARLLAAVSPHGGRVALCWDGGSKTYGELIAAAIRFAAEAGPHRQLVFLEAHRTWRSIATYLGCLIGGHPVHLYTSGADRPDALIAAYHPNLLVTGEDAAIERLHDEGHDLHPDLALLISTSGTTGTSRFVKLSAENLLSNARSIVDYLGITETDVAISSLPLSYSYGMSVLNSHLVAGGSMYLTETSPLDARFWREFDAAGATSFSGVPYVFQALGHAGNRFGDRATLRYVTQAGGKLPAEAVRQMAADAASEGWQFFVMYGQTEASPRIAYLPPDLARDFPESIGIAIPGGRIGLVDPSGAEVTAPGVEGELVYEGPNVMMGYAATPEELATDETPARLFTGDLACRNEQGLYTITGRSKRIVKPFGLRISLDALEADLAAIVTPVACIGDEESVVVAIPADKEESAASILDWMAERYEIPRSTFTILVVDQIPLLDNGKPSYRALQQLWAARHAPPRNSAGQAMALALKALNPRPLLQASIEEAKRMLGYRTASWASVAEIYRQILGAGEVGPDDTFTSLSGDSLSYIQTFMALEDYLGEVPPDWEEITVEALEARIVA
jgi:acyl-CoA synthetase (AMP-forming)/AMP-acid ligase II